MPPATFNTLRLQALTSLLKDNLYHDLIIQTQATEWKVHRAIVLPRCKVLESAYFALIDPPPTTSEASSTASNQEFVLAFEKPEDDSAPRLTINEDPGDIDMLLRYLYTFEVPSQAGAKLPTNEARRLIEFGKKYELEHFVEVAVGMLCILVKDIKWVDRHEQFDDSWRWSERLEREQEVFVKTALREVLVENMVWIENDKHFQWLRQRNWELHLELPAVPDRVD